MSLNADRAEVVRKLIETYDHVDTDFVRARLHCGRGQALRAIRQARFGLADDGECVSYAVYGNGYSVAANGDENERLRSYRERQQSIITQRKNAGRVIGNEASRVGASQVAKAIGGFALADAMDAEAAQIRLDTLADLLDE